MSAAITKITNTSVPIHLSNINGVTYLIGDEDKDGSIRQIESNGIFILQKKKWGVWKNVQISDEEETTIARSVKTGVGSFHLGDLHNISSAGENVVFRNNNSDICFFPVWQGITPNGVTEIPPQVRVYGALSTVMPNGSSPAGYGAINAVNSTLYAANTSFFVANVIAAEAYVGKLRWTVKFTGGIDVITFLFDVNVMVGGSLSIPFESPLDIRTGSNMESSLSKPDGTLFLVRPSSTMPTKPWYSANIRIFSDSNIYHYGNIEEIFSNNLPLKDANVGNSGVNDLVSREDHVHPREIIPVVQRFTTAGAATYTPTTGMRYCTIQGYGAGGAGGTTATATIVQVSGAGAGGSGGYTKVMATAAQVGASLALTIGAKGVATSTPNSTGPSGGATIVGSMFTCGGGIGGQPTSALVGALGAVGGDGGAGGVDTAVTGCTFIEGIDGERGDNTLIIGGAIVNGRGGSTAAGRGGYPGGTATGTSTTATRGNGIGSGGGGAAVNGLAGSVKGGDGANGGVIITEYF